MGLGRSDGAFRTDVERRPGAAEGSPFPIAAGERVRGDGSLEADSVAVLLSTFNGAEFLDSQIESILGQTWPRLRLVVRDDGSTDGTPLLLRKRKRDPRVVSIEGRNVGAKTSFLQLLGLVNSRSEFVAFSNQDDFWLPGKIERGVEALAAVDRRRPALYCSRGLLANRALTVTGVTPLWPRPPSFGNALVENIATGCTILLNPPAAAALRSAGAPDGAIMHDWWCYLVVSALGVVIFDPRPSALLRGRALDHGGVEGSSWRRMTNKVARRLRRDDLPTIVEQAGSFLCHFGHWPSLPPVHRELALALARGSSLARRALAADRRLERQFPIDDVLLRLRVLAGPWPRISPP